MVRVEAEFHFCGLPGDDGAFFVVEITEAMPLTENDNLRAPALIVTLHPSNAGHASLVGDANLLIVEIFRIRDASKIFNSIIFRVAVDVVDQIRRNFTFDEGPD
jgi:hypothetical protein